MDNISLVDLRGNDVNDFVKAYRDSLKQQYDANVSLIKQNKRENDGAMMGTANMRGMMFSNLPQRNKMKYEASTHLPALAKAYNTYQTGLDTLRQNAVKTYNSIKTLKEQIADLDES